MQNNSQKRGIALGAILAMLSSVFFGATLPANAAAVEGAVIAVAPAAGSASNFNGSILEDFPLEAYLLPGKSNSNFVAQKVRVEVTRLTGAVDIMVTSTSADLSALTTPASYSAEASNINPNAAASCVGTCSTLSAVVYAYQTTASQFTAMTLPNGGIDINIKAYTDSGEVTLSGLTATVKIKVFVENTRTLDYAWDENEDYTEETVTLHAVSAVPVTGAAISAMNSGDSVITVSSTVGALNFANLGGTYYLKMESTATNNLFTEMALAGASSTESVAITSNNMASRSGVLSTSFNVSASAGVSALDSVSARIMYAWSSGATAYPIGSTFSMVVANPGVTELFSDVVAGDNATQSAATATVRTNTTTTFKIGAKTTSGSVSKAVSVRFSSTPTLTANSKYISINGAASTTSWPSLTAPVTVTTGTDGFGTFTITNTGFVGNESFVLTAFVGNISKSLTVNVESATHSVAAEYSTYQSGAGETTNVVYTVTDQWGVNSNRSDQRLAVTKGGTGFNWASTTNTLSYVPVVAGVATFAFTPVPATATGSATVDASLQQLNVNSGGYDAMGVSAARVTVNVSATANAFGTGLAASRSVSVSYFPSTVSWATVTGKVTNTGSAVTVTAPGLIFRDNSGVTTSGAVTVRAGSGPQYSFEVASLLAGNYTMTLTNGTATTTSLLVVDAVSHSAGAAIAFDTTEITSGRTKIVVGTVTDANGNPVDTSGGTASILVTYAGTAGIPVGSMPTETDANGEFRISILTSAADNGSFTLTAVYLKDGSSTATADKITKVQAITVGSGSTSGDSADTKVNAGSFKGYVAVYAKGYEGQRLSAKIGNDWVVVESLASNFERVVDFTGAGYTIAVRIYIDRVLVDTITVTTK